MDDDFKADGLCFKVVRRKRGDPATFLSIIVHGPAAREYRLREVTRARREYLDRGYGLLAFATPEEALLFISEKKTNESVLECEYQKKMEMPEWRLSTCCMGNSGVSLKRLDRMLNKSPFVLKQPWPSGSIMVAAVRPIRFVKRFGEGE